MKSRKASLTWLIALLSWLLPAYLCAADWPTLRGDEQRSGVSSEILPASTLSEVWTTWTGASVDSSPAVCEGRVYVGNAAGEVLCLDAGNGAIIWRTRTQGAVVSSPAVHDDTVYVGSVDRCLYAFDAQNGKIRWRLRTWLPVVASPLVIDNRVCIGSMDGSFKCADVKDGSIIWEYGAGPISGSAAGFGDAVYYGDEEGNVFARQAQDGTLIWSAKVAGSVIRAPLVTEKHVLVGVMSPSALRAPNIDYLIAYDRETGQKIWAQNGQHSVMHTPIISAERVYYATVSGYTSTSTLFCCRLGDGGEVWKRGLAGVVDSSPILTGEFLLMGVHDGLFHVYRHEDGRDVHSIQVGAKIYSTPAIADGAVYFGSGDGFLHCLRPAPAPQ